MLPSLRFECGKTIREVHTTNNEDLRIRLPGDERDDADSQGRGRRERALRGGQGARLLI